MVTNVCNNIYEVQNAIEQRSVVIRFCELIAAIICMYFVC